MICIQSRIIFLVTILFCHDEMRHFFPKRNSIPNHYRHGQFAAELGEMVCKQTVTENHFYTHVFSNYTWHDTMTMRTYKFDLLENGRLYKA